jgi:hypothetical protein
LGAGASQPFRMLDQRNEEFDGGRGRDRCQPWSGDGAHLVQRPVRQTLQYRTQAIKILFDAQGRTTSRLREPQCHYSNSIPTAGVQREWILARAPCLITRYVSKAERRVEHDLKTWVGSQHQTMHRESDPHLPLGCSYHRRQPSTFSGIHQEEDSVVLVDQFFQSRDILLRLVDRSWRDGVSRHWNRQFVPDCVLKPNIQVISQGYTSIHLRHQGRSSSACQLRRQL